jgi:hypothetical protein
MVTARLQQQKVHAGSHPSTIADAYTYCANGDHTNMSYQAGSNNQLFSAETYSYTYDNEVNLKTRTKIAIGKARTYTCNYRNL